jgi:hypothetical protein
MKYNNTSKFTFDYTWRDSDENVVSRTRHTTADETLSDVLNAFEMFLRGSGFVFDGTLDIVNDTTNEPTHMNQQIEMKLFENKQLEFDFVKELFKDSIEDIDKSEDIDT